MKRPQIAMLALAVALPLSACAGGDDTSPKRSNGDTTSTSAGGREVPSPESDSEFVRHLQEELDHLGFHAGPVDGVWGAMTSDALASFQAERGINPTGRYDAATAEALSEAADDANALTVEVLQEKLEELGFYQDLVDGAYGESTEAAVRSYQEARGLAATGTLTHETLAALVDEHTDTIQQEHIDSATDLGIGGVDQVVEAPASDGDDLLRQGSEGPEVEELQRRLAELGYRPGEADGRFGAATASAVLAFEKAEGIDRDGVAGPEVMSRLEAPEAAGPRSNAPGPRVEVDLDRQILFLIDANGAVTTINVSTGSGRQYETPSGMAVAYTPDGDFAINRSIDGLRKAELGTLYRPFYFNEGWAIHGSSKVPAYPASHGCVRTANWDQDFLWTVLSEGDEVEIYGHNPGDAGAGVAGA